MKMNDISANYQRPPIDLDNVPKLPPREWEQAVDRMLGELKKDLMAKKRIAMEELASGVIGAVSDVLEKDLKSHGLWDLHLEDK